MLREFERAELFKYRPFAAFGAYVRRADKTAVQFLAFADAAFLRTCSGTHFAVQRISPEQPFG